MNITLNDTRELMMRDAAAFFGIPINNTDDALEDWWNLTMESLDRYYPDWNGCRVQVASIAQLKQQQRRAA